MKYLLFGHFSKQTIALMIFSIGSLLTIVQYRMNFIMTTDTPQYMNTFARHYQAYGKMVLLILLYKFLCEALYTLMQK